MPERELERASRIKIVLHSEFRRAAGLKELELTVGNPISVRSLLGALAELVPALQETINQTTSEPALGSQVLVMVNRKIAGWDTIVQPGDRVQLMPPISGG
jgi:molybdopterin converting factor small subunit